MPRSILEIPDHADEYAEPFEDHDPGAAQIDPSLEPTDRVAKSRNVPARFTSTRS